MKRLRSTLFLLILVVLGGAYIYWNERGPSVSRGAVVLLRAPRNEVRRVILQPSGVVFEAQSSNEFRVRNQKTGLLAPLDDEAGSALWKQIALVQSSLVVQNPENLKRYGLDKPRGWIEVDGRKLELGAPASFDKRRVYARGEGHIALVGADLLAKCRQPFSRWRERRVMRGTESAQVFRLHSLSNDLDFRRDGAQWHFRALQSLEKSVKADNATVEAALSALSNTKITRWLDERGQNPARYGLDGAQIVFEWNKKRLEVGAKTGGGYAARLVDGAAKSARTPVFEVPASLVALLNRPVKKWRDTRVAAFDFEAIGRLEVRSGAQSRVLKRDGTTWRAETGETSQKLNSAALDLLDFAHNLRASDFVDDTARDAARFGLNSPILTLKATQMDGVVAFELRFGRIGTKLWAQNRVDKVTDPIFELAPTALDATQAARANLFGPKD